MPPPFSQALGLAREALFYQHLTPLLESTLLNTTIVPRTYYNTCDMATGVKCIIMEDLSSPHWVDSGIFFGPGNPNNWSRILPQLVQESCPHHRPPTPPLVAEVTFCAVAVVHAAFWRRSGLLLDNKSWLRGQEWLQGRGRDSWEASQQIVREICTRAKDRDGLLQSDPVLRAAVDKAIQGISWEKQLERLNLWPGNVLWNTTGAGPENPSRSVRRIDWEMVGLGSGPPQDLSQYVLSNMDPAVRRSCERHLVETYFKALCLAGVNNSTSEQSPNQK
jgi:hypothetical protein